MKRILPLLCLGLLSLAAVQAAPKLEDVVEQLGDDDFNVRQKASDELMQRVEKDPEFAKQLQRFAQHEDPEIRFRIAELIKDLPELLQWMDPAKEKDVKSLNMSPDRLKLTFRNRSKITIKTYWIDWSGDRVARRVLKPGEEAVIAVTFREHYWLVTDENEKGLGLYCPGKKDAMIVYTGKEGKEEN